MGKKKGTVPEKAEGLYWVYMLECRNGSYYTGYTVDIVRRYKQHISGKGSARFTRGFGVTGMARCWQVRGSKGDAMRIEHFIKSGDRRFKDEIVADPRILKKTIMKTFAVTIVPFDPRKVEDACDETAEAVR